tara:strand:- start:394 stop:513 length:120 start_codon:yes stop_codon:yes gene_type:complete
MEKIIIMIPLIIIVGFVGIMMGMYLASQIEKHVYKRTKK